MGKRNVYILCSLLWFLKLKQQVFLVKHQPKIWWVFQEGASLAYQYRRKWWSLTRKCESRPRKYRIVKWMFFEFDFTRYVNYTPEKSYGIRPIWTPNSQIQYSTKISSWSQAKGLFNQLEHMFLGNVVAIGCVNHFLADVFCSVR